MPSPCPPLPPAPQALYGISRVLVLDFDEFIYCPTAPPYPHARALLQAQDKDSKDKDRDKDKDKDKDKDSKDKDKDKDKEKDKERGYKPQAAIGPVLASTARDLGRYINTVTATLQSQGLRQIMVQQRVTMNKTQSVRDCLVAQASASPPLSLFSCYGGFKYERASHSIKSFHLGTTCPLTGYHQACPAPQTPRAYDCACPCFDVDAKQKDWPYPVPPLAASVKCALFHLSSNQ